MASASCPSSASLRAAPTAACAAASCSRWRRLGGDRGLNAFAQLGRSRQLRLFGERPFDGGQRTLKRSRAELCARLLTQAQHVLAPAREDGELLDPRRQILQVGAGPHARLEGLEDGEGARRFPAVGGGLGVGELGGCGVTLPRRFADRGGTGLGALEERRHVRQIAGGPRQAIEAAQRLFEPAGLDLGGRRAGLFRHPLRLAAPFDLAPQIARRPIDVGMRRRELLELLQRQLVLAGGNPGRAPLSSASAARRSYSARRASISRSVVERCRCCRRAIAAAIRGESTSWADSRSSAAA